MMGLLAFIPGVWRARLLAGLAVVLMVGAGVLWYRYEQGRRAVERAAQIERTLEALQEMQVVIDAQRKKGEAVRRSIGELDKRALTAEEEAVAREIFR
jgi:Flp pilus assembly protein TadB